MAGNGKDIRGDNANYFENPQYRLIEYLHHKDDDLFIRICGIEHCLPGKVAGSPDRPGYHLHAVISGKGRLWVDEVCHEIHGGQLFLTVPGVSIRYEADEKDPWLYCWTTFEGKKAASYLADAGFTEGVYCKDCHIDVNRFLQLSQEMLAKPNLNLSSELYRLGLAYRFLSLAVESYEETHKNAGAYKDLTIDDYILYATRYIQSNYASVQIKNVSEYIGLNRTYFTEIFKEKMYMSPQEYLMKTRLNHACELLETTDLPIRSIAANVGYDNPLTFSKIFKRRQGVSPAAYRDAHRREPDV